MNRTRVILFCGILIGMSILLARPAHLFRQQIAYAQERQRAASVVESLAGRCPHGTDLTEWNVASGWAVTAYHNVCFSPSHVELEELRRFRVDVETQCAPEAEIGITTIDWLWQRLADTGSHGKDYVGRFRPLYLEELAAARKQHQ